MEPGWELFGADSMASVNTYSYQGGFSGSVTHDSSSFYGIEQALTGIVGDESYTVSARTLLSDAEVLGVKLRIAWYSSSDASGSQLSTENSPVLSDQHATAWQLLTFSPTAPPSAQSAKLRLVFETTGSPGTVFFDRVMLYCSALTAIDDLYEDNDTALTAKTIAIGEEQQHNFFTADDDWVSFSVPAGGEGNYRVETFVDAPAANDTEVLLYASSDLDTPLAVADDKNYPEDTGSRFTHMLTEGDYLLLIRPSAGGGATGPGTMYSIVVKKE